MVDRARREDREITGEMLSEDAATRLAIENQRRRLPTPDAPPQIVSLGFTEILLPVAVGQVRPERVLLPDTPATQPRRTADVAQRDTNGRGNNRVISLHEDWHYPDGSSEYRYQDRAGNIHYRQRRSQAQGGGETRYWIAADGHMQQTEWRQMSLVDAWRRAATHGRASERSMTEAQRQEAAREGRLPSGCEAVRDQQGRIIPGVCVTCVLQQDYFPTGHVSTRRENERFQIDPENAPSHTPEQIREIISRARNHIRRHEAPLTARDWDAMRPGYDRLDRQ